MARLLVVIESVSPFADFVRRVNWLDERPHLLLKPGIALEPGEIFRPGDSLVLNRPDGSTLIARIGGSLEVGYNRSRHGGWVTYDSCIAVPDLAPDDVPPGTEVWSVDPP
jgi:hypothetical protein